MERVDQLVVLIGILSERSVIYALNCIITKIVFDPLLSLYGFSTQHVEAKHQFLSLCQKVFGCFYGLSLAPIIRVLQLSLG